MLLKNYISQEIQFLIDLFVENGRSKLFLENLVHEYQNVKKKNEKNSSCENMKKLPWIPNIVSKLTQQLKKFGQPIAFTSRQNLQRMFYNNRTNLLLSSLPIIYQLDCICNHCTLGNQRKKLTRSIEYIQDSMKENWNSTWAKERAIVLDNSKAQNSSLITIHVQKFAKRKK